MTCGEDWANHFGIPCREMEKKDEANVRKTAEEKMTAALLRRCHKCQTPLIKEEGCNKLTCRCGAKMCYICRYLNVFLFQNSEIRPEISLYN